MGNVGNLNGLTFCISLLENLRKHKIQSVIFLSRMLDKRCIRKIGIFRALQLGDLMCSIPAIRAIRNEFPDAEIFLIGLPGAQSFIKRFPKYFNGLIKFPGYPGLPEQPYEVDEIPEFLRSMQKHKFDLIIQMQGNGNIVNPLIETFGAKFTAGFHRPNDYIPEGGLFIEYPEGHEVERHLMLTTYLGITSQGKHLEFPLTDEDTLELENSGLMLEPDSYVCIHPGSRGSWRQWPVEHFALIGDLCAAQGKTVVLTGTSDEIDRTEQTASLMQTEAVIATGKTSLGAIGRLIENAFAIVSNCTGVSHIASALNTPGIIISMDGEPHRWGPLNKDILTTIDWLNYPQFDLAENALHRLLQKAQDNQQVNYRIFGSQTG